MSLMKKPMSCGTVSCLTISMASLMRLGCHASMGVMSWAACQSIWWSLMCEFLTMAHQWNWYSSKCKASMAWLFTVLNPTKAGGVWWILMTYYTVEYWIHQNQAEPGVDFDGLGVVRFNDTAPSNNVCYFFIRCYGTIQVSQPFDVCSHRTLRLYNIVRSTIRQICRPRTAGNKLPQLSKGILTFIIFIIFIIFYLKCFFCFFWYIFFHYFSLFFIYFHLFSLFSLFWLWLFLFGKIWYRCIKACARARVRRYPTFEFNTWFPVRKPENPLCKIWFNIFRNRMPVFHNNNM